VKAQSFKIGHSSWWISMKIMISSKINPTRFTERYAKYRKMPKKIQNNTKNGPKMDQKLKIPRKVERGILLSIVGKKKLHKKIPEKSGKNSFYENVSTKRMQLHKM
jgi:hypothetical protein